MTPGALTGEELFAGYYSEERRNHCEAVASSAGAPGVKQVFVKDQTGQKSAYLVDDSFTVRELQLAVQAKRGISACRQRLIHAGSQLADDHLLTAYGVQDGSTLHLIVRLGGC